MVSVLPSPVNSTNRGGVDGGDEDSLGALMARLRLPRPARTPSVVWRGDASPCSPTPTYKPNSPLFVPAEDVVGEEGEGGSKEIVLEASEDKDDDEEGEGENDEIGEAGEVESGMVASVALKDPFGDW